MVWILVPKVMLFWFFSWCVQTLVGFPTVKYNIGIIHNKKSIEKLPCSTLKPQKFKNKVKVKYLEQICVQDKGAILCFEPALILAFDV